jgi:hypothetical protein
MKEEREEEREKRVREITCRHSPSNKGIELNFSRNTPTYKKERGRGREREKERERKSEKRRALTYKQTPYLLTQPRRIDR